MTLRTLIASTGFLVLAAAEAEVGFQNRILFSTEELKVLRHEHPPVDRDADPSYPVTEYSALMHSPCHPELDGYFGSTSGDPVVMRYTFELEATTFDHLDTALEALNQRVMDSVLAGVFPGVCDPDRPSITDVEISTKVTGFFFSPESLSLSEACRPVFHNRYACAVFQGHVGIFGHNLNKQDIDDTTRHILSGLNSAVPAVAGAGVVRVLATNEMLSQISGPVVIGITKEATSTTSTSMTPGSKIGIAFATVALVAGMVSLWFMVRNTKRDRKKQVTRLILPARSSRSVSKRKEGGDTEESESSTLMGHRVYLEEDGSGPWCETPPLSFVSLGLSSQESSDEVSALHGRLPRSAAIGFEEMTDSLSDIEKLRKAFSEVTSAFGSLDNILEAFGLKDLPPTHQYGIIFGFMVYILTIAAVLCLLSFGGTFKRLVEQSEPDGKPAVLSATDARSQRSLLLETLLESRERMLRKYPETSKTEKVTALTEMLLNEKPQQVGGKKHISGSMQAKYEESYVAAYRRCQDRPGGSILSGRPEARFEAYARGFAGCGPHVSMAYRRSYGRVYEATCCASLKSDDKYSALFQDRPQDIVGRFVRLEALTTDRHLEALFKLTSGAPELDSKAYAPNEVWGFAPEGPFDKPESLKKSFVFQRRNNEAAFAIVNNVTDKLMGAILLINDDPRNLSIQMEPPIMQPDQQDGSREQLESCFLLIERLVAHGYRRIQLAIDSQDAINRKLASRLGFTMEGVLYKHMVIKEASRDSNVYGMLNSDWTRGARNAMFAKLYGKNAAKADSANEMREAEYDEHARASASSATDKK